MKNIFAIFLLLTPIMHVIAQPVINRSHLMVPGDEFIIASANTVPDPGEDGANVTWNFSGVQSAGSANYVVAEADGTPYAGDYPGANIAFVNPGALFQYHFIDFNAWEDHGNVVPGFSRLVYNDPRLYLAFPVMYNAQWDDAFTYTINYQTAPPITTHGEGTTDGEVDAYGTLILPQGVFTDALRVRMIGEYTDTTVLGSGLYERNYFHETVYVWLSPSYHAPLCTHLTLEIERITTVITGDTMTFPETINVSSFSFDPTAEPSSAVRGDITPGVYSLEISPNPFMEEVQISFTADQDQEMKFTLQDLNGHIVYEEMLSAQQGENHLELQLPGIPSGTYLAFLRSKNVTDVQRLISVNASK